MKNKNRNIKKALALALGFFCATGYASENTLGVKSLTFSTAYGFRVFTLVADGSAGSSGPCSGVDVSTVTSMPHYQGAGLSEDVANKMYDNVVSMIMAAQVAGKKIKMTTQSDCVGILSITLLN